MLVGGVIFGFVLFMVQFGDDVVKIVDKFGIGIEELQELCYVVE